MRFSGRLNQLLTKDRIFILLNLSNSMVNINRFFFFRRTIFDLLIFQQIIFIIFLYIIIDKIEYLIFLNMIVHCMAIGIW